MSEISGLQWCLKRSFPIAGFLGAEIVESSPDSVVLSARYGECCRNHHATVFGGATACLALLAAWSTLYIALDPDERNWTIAVRRFTCDYVSPIRSDLLARACLPEGFDISDISRPVGRHGMAAIELPMTVHSEGSLAYRGIGQFVVHRNVVAAEVSDDQQG